MVQLYFLRHGQTDWNLAHRLQGHTDVPLNPTGLEQARSLRDFFLKNPIDAVWTSDLKRAIQTAQAMAPDTPISTDWRLREANLGAAEGLTQDEVKASMGEALWTGFLSTDLRDQDVTFPGGESKRDHLARLVGGIEGFLNRRERSFVSKPTSVAIVTHGGSMVRLIAQFAAPGALPPGPIRIANGAVLKGTAWRLGETNWRIEINPGA